MMADHLVYRFRNTYKNVTVNFFNGFNEIVLNFYTLRISNRAKAKTTYIPEF